MMKDGVILPGPGAPFGFRDDLFEGYLWKISDSIMISLIESIHPGRGDFKRLVDNILAARYTVKIPCPLSQMKRLVEKNGYTKTYEKDEVFGEDVEVWVLKPEGKK